MQPMKFRVKDEEHSKAIQEKLFSLGVRWSNRAGVQYTDRDYLYAEKYLSWSNDEGQWDTFFEDNTNEEYILLDGEFVPADSVAEAVEPISELAVEGPVTSDGGSSGYYKLRITNRKGETIECETGDIIRCMLDNDFDLGNILKALRRMSLASKGSGKAGTDIAYDVKKSKYFLDEFEHWNT